MNNEQKTDLVDWLSQSLEPNELETLADSFDLHQLEHNLHLFDQLTLHRLKNIDESWDDFVRMRPDKKPRFRFKKFIAAILLLAVIGLSLYVFIKHHSTHKTQVIETLKGQDFVGNLPDGSSYHLNSFSTLELKPGLWTEKREVKLKGQALFKVTTGGHFDVVTSQGIVSVVGTHFDVSCYGEYMTVCCYEGKVRVAGMSNKEYYLKMGQKIQLGKDYVSEVTSVKDLSPDWLDKDISFENTTLKDVFLELQKYYEINFEDQNNNKTRRFTGHVPTNDLNKTLQLIFIPLDIKYKHSGNSVVF